MFLYQVKRLCNVYWKNKKIMYISIYLKFRWVVDFYSIHFKQDFPWENVINSIGRKNGFSFFEWKHDSLWWNVMLCIQRQMPWDIFLRKNMIENYFLNQIFLLWHWFYRFHFLKLLFISLFKLMVWILNVYMFFLFKVTVLIFLMIVTTTWFDYIKITTRIIVQR